VLKNSLINPSPFALIEVTRQRDPWYYLHLSRKISGGSVQSRR